jgi:hypothetical protein
MKFTIELEHPELNRVRLLVNNDQRLDSVVERTWTGSVDVTQPVRIELGFWPWQIKPLLRINGNLVDYGIARVDQFDHALCFDLYRDYFKIYGESLVNSRVYSQFKDGAVDEKIYDAVIGHGRRHTELIESIKKLVQL